jgi:p-aminobenzoyl-glutamate transporter AbgT
MEFYDIVINTHSFVSLIFTLIALIILARSIRGWSQNKAYTKFDSNFSVIFLVFLYLQLILGVLLYFVLGDHSGSARSMQDAVEQMSLRFWALEHFVIMIFALFLSQLGWIFIRNARLDINKHKNTLFYFGISILLIVISTGIGLIWR